MISKKSQIREQLVDLHAYLTLVFAVKVNLIQMPEEVRRLLTAVGEFAKEAKASDLKARGTQFLIVLERMVSASSTILPCRIAPREVARDFQKLSHETDVFRFGVPYGWLAERFEISALPLPPDLPFHAKVGVGHHAGNASVEELFLLEDAFFLFSRAEAANRRMHAAAEKLKSSGASQVDKSQYRMLASLNGEVGTFSRLTVVTAAGFVEAFVNSVGWNEATVRKGLSAETSAQLRGTRNDRYLSLETKLERFPKFIREDGSSPIVVSDPRQIAEPFLSFLRETKEVRDASMHYAPGKAPIWRPPQDWLSSAEKAVKSAVAVALAFWQACYPSRSLPIYLDELNYERFLKRAREHVEKVDGTQMNGSDS